MPTWIIPAPTGPTTGAGLVGLIENLTSWFFVGFIVLAIFFVILAGLQFITGGGDPQQVAQARSKLMWAAIAIVAAAFSRGVVAAIQAIVGG